MRFLLAQTKPELAAMNAEPNSITLKHSSLFILHTVSVVTKL